MREKGIPRIRGARLLYEECLKSHSRAFNISVSSTIDENEIRTVSVVATCLDNEAAEPLLFS